MRGFGGLSFGRRGLRAGVSSSGRPWLGARAGKAGAYVGVRSGGAVYPKNAKVEIHSITFRVEDDGRVFLGDAELDVEDLRLVIEVSDANREEKKS